MPRTFVLLIEGEPVGTASLVAHDLEEKLGGETRRLSSAVEEAEANLKHAAAKAKDQDKIIADSETLSAACAGCHRKWRDRKTPANRCK